MSTLRESINVAGIERVGDSRAHILRRVIWMLMVLGGVGFLIYHLQNRFDHFLDDPVNVNILYETSSWLDLPAVTVCHEGKAHIVRVEAIKESNISEIDMAALRVAIERTIPRQRLLKTLLANKTEAFDWASLIRRFAITQQKTVARCSVAGQICNRTFVESLTKAGICFTYEPGKVSAVGISDGIMLQLKHARNDDDLFVRLHHPHLDMPHEFRSFTTIKDGTYSEISIKQTSVYLLKGCGRRQLRYFEEYSRMNKTVELCGCKPFYAPTNMNAEQCALEPSIQLLNCINRVEKGPVESTECPTDCQQTIYDWNILQSRNPPTSDTSGQISTVIIYFSDLQVMKIEQQQAYTWLAMLSDIGGAFGLVLGGCILTVVQVVDFIGLFVFKNFRFCYSQRTRAQRHRRPTLQTSFPTHSNTLQVPPRNEMPKTQFIQRSETEETMLNDIALGTAGTNGPPKRPTSINNTTHHHSAENQSGPAKSSSHRHSRSGGAQPKSQRRVHMEVDQNGTVHPVPSDSEDRHKHRGPSESNHAGRNRDKHRHNSSSQRHHHGHSHRRENQEHRHERRSSDRQNEDELHTPPRPPRHKPDQP